MSRQYISCVFSAGGREYAYHNDGDPVAVGDEVRVESRSGAEATVSVKAILNSAPTFQTKPIIGKAPEPEAKP